MFIKMLTWLGEFQQSDSKHKKVSNRIHRGKNIITVMKNLYKSLYSSLESRRNDQEVQRWTVDFIYQRTGVATL